jgi:hypothetical protein
MALLCCADAERIRGGFSFGETPRGRIHITRREQPCGARRGGGVSAARCRASRWFLGAPSFFALDAALAAVRSATANSGHDGMQGQDSCLRQSLRCSSAQCTAGSTSREVGLVLSKLGTAGSFGVQNAAGKMRSRCDVSALQEKLVTKSNAATLVKCSIRRQSDTR